MLICLINQITSFHTGRRAGRQAHTLEPMQFTGSRDICEQRCLRLRQVSMYKRAFSQERTLKNILCIYNIDKPSVQFSSSSLLPVTYIRYRSLLLLSWLCSRVTVLTYISRMSLIKRLSTQNIEQSVRIATHLTINMAPNTVKD